MLDVPANRLKPHRLKQRPPFERIALLLQGGGALGSYQAGVYQALDEANLHPDWVAGISIGSVNAALIAGNPPEKRVDKLREFWEEITAPPLDSFGFQYDPSIQTSDASVHQIVNQIRALFSVLFGAPHFFTPRMPPPYLCPPDSPKTLSYYDTTPLKATLGRLVDFHRINAGNMRFSVGSTNIRTGEQIYFDNTTHRIGPEHVMASGALPPGLPPQDIDGELYWDGGIVSNAPLPWMLDSAPRKDTLAFQIDIWSRKGEVPRDFTHAALREKEIRYASRTQVTTDQFKNVQKFRTAVAELLKQLPDDLRKRPEAKSLAEQADEKVYNIVHLIYHSKTYEGFATDFQFSRQSMEDHWQAGYADGVRSLSHPEVLQRPDKLEGVRTFDWSATVPHARLMQVNQ
ncbi:MAG: patatin-like phospholipase family protein [Rhodomicrobium sp.]